MEKIIHTDSGCSVIAKDGKYYVRYDAGGFVVQMREDEISEEEALKCKSSSQGLYEVLLACEARIK